ncbi:MAG: PAS domain-containing protein, partial [Methanogenium sp.]|nr:PAS domain-containing protein [Methanogenium sp.]
KKTGYELKESERKYGSLVEEQSDMICRFSIPERRITFVNRLLCSHFGFQKKELIGEDISNIFPQSLCENIKSIQNNTPSDSIVSHYETKIVDITKISFWQKWKIQPVFNKENKLVAFNSIGKNITHKKES